MNKTIDIDEAQKNLHELVSRALEGDEVILTENDRPLARIVPVAQGSRIAGLNEGAMKASDDFDEPLSDDFWNGGE
jgi:prevent-host-death family protein